MSEKIEAHHKGDREDRSVRWKWWDRTDLPLLRDSIERVAMLS